MRTYADSSFILRLITGELDTATSVAEYRRLGKPRLFYLGLHKLEVLNGIYQRAFFEKKSVPSNQRQSIIRLRDAALARVDTLLARGALVETPINMEKVFETAAVLTRKYTERIGARSIDLLHVASALALESENFCTSDLRQAAIARGEGLLVHLIE